MGLADRRKMYISYNDVNVPAKIALTKISRRTKVLVYGKSRPKNCPCPIFYIQSRGEMHRWKYSNAFLNVGERDDRFLRSWHEFQNYLGF